MLIQFENDQNNSPQNIELAMAALRTMERDWSAAASNWDIKELSALYTDNALFYGARPGLSVGRDGVLDYFRSYAGILKSVSLSLVDQHIIILSENSFVAQGYGVFDFLSEKNNRSQATLRTTWMLLKSDEIWKIGLHHFSLTPEAPPIPE